MKLIEDWHKAYKFLSVAAATVGGAAYTAVEIFDKFKVMGFDVEPPKGLNDIIVYSTVAGVVLGRIVKQGGPTVSLPKAPESKDAADTLKELIAKEGIEYVAKAIARAKK